MGLRFALALLLLVALQHAAYAVKFIIPFKDMHCVYASIDTESLQDIDPLDIDIEGAVMVQGNAPGNANFNSRRNIDLRVKDPKGVTVWEQRYIWQQTSFKVKNSGMGTYSLCITNNGASRLDVTVDISYFTLSHLRRPNTEVTAPKGTAQSRGEQLVQHVHLRELHSDVQLLQELLDNLSNEQKYFKKRLERQYQTNQSVHSRTLTFTCVELAALLAVAAAQVACLHYFFGRKQALSLRI